MTTEDGGPAFPRAAFEYCDPGTGSDWAMKEQRGASLRDYFAAKAMQGFLTGDALVNESDTSSEWLGKTAKASYEMADAMLAARKP